MLVVTGELARAGVPSETRCGEDPLPEPLAGRRWMLPAQGVREQNLSVALLEVALVETADLHQVALERPAETPRECRHPVAPALALPDRELRAGEVEVLDPKSQALHQTEASSVDQRGLQPARAVQVAQHGPHLVPGQDHG